MNAFLSMKATQQGFKGKLQIKQAWQCGYGTSHKCILCFRILCSGDYIFSSSYDKTARAWLFDTSELATGNESAALVKTFEGHTKGVYPLIFIPSDREELGLDDGGYSSGDDILITGSSDSTAKSWSCETGLCLKVCPCSGLSS